MSERKIPPFEIKKDPEFRTVYATGVFGSLGPKDGYIVFYLDHVEPKMQETPPGSMATEKVIREILVEVHVSPQQFKSIRDWMTKHIDRLEKQMGKIPVEKEERKLGLVV